MAVRSHLLSVAAVLTCLTVNEALACPTQHDIVAPATQAFSHDVEDESISTYIGELAASARSSSDGSVSNINDSRPASVETVHTDGKALMDFPASSAPDVSELTVRSEEARHLLDIEDESASTYSRGLGAASASVEIAGTAKENPAGQRELTNLNQSPILNNDLDPVTTGSVPLDPWAVHHRRDE